MLYSTAKVHTYSKILSAHRYFIETLLSTTLLLIITMRERASMTLLMNIDIFIRNQKFISGWYHATLPKRGLWLNEWRHPKKQHEQNTTRPLNVHFIVIVLVGRVYLLSMVICYDPYSVPSKCTHCQHMSITHEKTQSTCHTTRLI